MHVVKMNLEKQDRSQKNFIILFDRLAEIGAKVDEQYAALIPEEASSEVRKNVNF